MKPIHTYASEWRCARRLFPKTSLRGFLRNNKRRRSDTRLVPHRGTARKRLCHGAGTTWTWLSNTFGPGSRKDLCLNDWQKDWTDIPRVTRLQLLLSHKSNTKDFAFAARYVRLRIMKSLASSLNDQSRTGIWKKHSGVNCASYGQFAGAAKRSSFNNERIGFRDQMNLMTGRGDLLKLYRQRDARTDQLGRAPDSYRRRRSPNVSLVSIFWVSFFRRNFATSH